MTRLTCCMPVYNGEKYLAEAIESILGQTCSDFRLLIALDGSTDGSREIVEAYATNDPRIDIIDRKENRGLIYTRNEMLVRTATEFLACMDSDDVALPERFGKQVAHMDVHPECVAVGCQVIVTDPEGADLCVLPSPEDHEAIDAWHLKGSPGSAITNPAILMRTQAVKDAGGYADDTAPAEDYDLYLRLAERGTLANLPEVLLRYRRHFSAAGMDTLSVQRNSIRRSVERARQRRGLPPVDVTLRVGTPEMTPWHAHRQWAIWALRGGHLKTARRHAWIAWSRRPFSPRSNLTLLRTLFGIRG